MNHHAVGETPILGIDDLLGRFKAEGETESSERSFTLDPKKALERLAKFQLPDPYSWVLKVLQCLHLSGAQNVEVNAGINNVRVKADAAPAGFANMEDLLSQLLADAEDCTPSLRHLAAGLQGSLAVQPHQIKLTICRDGDKRTYLLEAGGWRDGGRGPAGFSQEHFELNLVRSLSEKLGSSWFMLNTDIFDLLFKKKASLDKEYKAIDRSCNYSRFRIRAGNEGTNSRHFGHPRFKGYDIRNDRDPGAARPPGLQGLYEQNLIRKAAHLQHHLAEMVVPSERPGGFVLEPYSHATVTNRIEPEMREASAKLGLSRAYAIRMEMARTSRVVFWEDGIMLGFKPLQTDVPGLVALVDARGLRKDLSSLKVQESAALEAIYDEVREAGRILKERIRENLHLMPAPDYVKHHLGIS